MSKNNLRKILAFNIKKYRKELNLTQTDLANLCDTSTNYIALIETCKRFPREEILEKISFCLNKKVYELFIDNNILLDIVNDSKTEFVSNFINYLTKELKKFNLTKI